MNQVPKTGNCETCYECGIYACKHLQFACGEPDGCAKNLDYVDGTTTCPEFEADVNWTMEKLLLQTIYEQDSKLSSFREDIINAIDVIEKALTNENMEDQVRTALKRLKAAVNLTDKGQNVNFF